MSIRRAFPLLRANIPSASMPIQRALFSSTPRVQAAMAPAPPLKPVYTPLGTKAKEEKPADGVIVSETNRAEKTFGRFWKSVSVKHTPEGIQILLDSRPLRTPGGKQLLLPPSKAPTAFLIANEWENQTQVLKNHALPVTSLTSRAIDALTSDSGAAEAQTATHPQVCAALLKYLDTDTICFQEERPRALVRLQEERWDPILTWTREHFGVDVNVYDGLFISKQPQATRERLADHIAAFDGWKLAAFERSVYTTKSFLVALALVEGRLTVEEASLASHVEVDSQIDVWGEVEDTHDVDYQDVRRQLGSVRCLLLDVHPVARA